MAFGKRSIYLAAKVAHANNNFKDVKGGFYIKHL